MSKLTLPTSHAVRHLVFRCVIKSRTQKYVARNYRQFIEAVYYISIFSIHDFFKYTDRLLEGDENHSSMKLHIEIV